MQYENWLASVSGLSLKKKLKLLELCGGSEGIFNMEESRINFLDFLTEREQNLLRKAKTELDPEELSGKLKEKGITCIPYNSEQYPDKLRQISKPPYALFVKGNMPEKEKKQIAIVGARKCTHYGEAMAIEYAKALAEYDVEIISGMARGIDGAGQRGAIMNGGTTYAVLGCGVDICYPKEHQGLYMDIQKHGGVISEFPPETPPFSANFPARNRIISALSDVVLVIEAKERSGSLITADMALEQGRDVYALPGPVTSPLSQGCHRLIREGAGILITPEELIRELHLEKEKRLRNLDQKKKVLEKHENIVYSCLDLYPKGVQALVEETGLRPEQVLRELISLELDGKVKEISKNQYVRGS